MSINRFLSSTSIIQEWDTHYTYLQMDLPDYPLSTRPTQTGKLILIELDRNGRFGLIDNLERQFGSGSVLARTRIRNDHPEPLLPIGRVTYRNYPHKLLLLIMTLYKFNFSYGTSVHAKSTVLMSFKSKATNYSCKSFYGSELVQIGAPL